MMEYDVEIKRSANGSIDLAYYDAVSRNLRGADMRAAPGQARKYVRNYFIGLMARAKSIDFLDRMKAPV